MEGWVSSEEDVVCSALLQQGPLLQPWMTWPRYTKTTSDPPNVKAVKVRAVSRQSCGSRLQCDAALSVQQQSEDRSVTCLFVGISFCSVALRGISTMWMLCVWQQPPYIRICPSGSECCIAVWMCASFHGDVVEEVVHRESFLVRFSEWLLNKDRKEKTVWYL